MGRSNIWEHRLKDTIEKKEIEKAAGGTTGRYQEEITGTY